MLAERIGTEQGKHRSGPAPGLGRGTGFAPRRRKDHQRTPASRVDHRHCSQDNCPAGATFSGRSPGKSVDSTSVTSPRRARIFWKFSGRSSRLVGCCQSLVSDRACNPRLNGLHGTDAEISPDFQMVFPLWSGRGPALVTTAEVNQRPAQMSL